MNYWGTFGNVFEKGLEDSLKSEKINHAKLMLLGIRESKEGIPCSNCKLYKNMKKHNSWIKLEALK